MMACKNCLLAMESIEMVFELKRKATYLLSGSISVQRKAILQKASGHGPQYFSRNIILFNPKSGFLGK